MKQHTFVICAYGESPYLEDCICSLKAQKVKSEILLATSTPNAFLEETAHKYELPYYINEGEGGITHDWNFAYAKADTPYVTLAHQDDIYDPAYTQKAMELLSKAKRPLIFFCDYYEIRGEKMVKANQILRIKRLMLLPLRVKLLWKSKFVRRRILSFGSPICCPSVVYAKENLPEPVFQHRYRSCEDWEAWEMISNMPGEFVYTRNSLMGHRIHEASATSAIIHDHQRSEEEYQIFRKFWPKPIAKMLVRWYAKSQKSNELK